jgi:radical SAM protein with 4Fe4S-binding SPASM domain
MIFLDRLFPGRFRPDLSNADAHAGLIVVPADQVQRESTRHRIRAIAKSLADAGVPHYRVFVPSGDTSLLSDEFPIARKNDLAGFFKKKYVVVLRSDQYHVAHEWVADLLGRARASGASQTHENYKSLLVGHLTLRCAFVVVHPSAASRAAEFIATGVDPIGLVAALESVAQAVAEVQVTAKNVFPFYRQAATMDIPISYVVETNSSCNYHCLMCPYHGGRQKHKPTFLKPGTYVDMPIETFKRVVDEIAALPHPYQDDPPITISPYRRGEFLLYPHWREALLHIKSKPGIKAYFSSNGSLWTDEDVEFALDIGLDHVQISIEGHDLESHRRIRLNSEYEKIASTIRRLMKRREERGMKVPYLQIAHTVNEKNYGLVDDYVKYWLHKVDALFIGPENYADEGTNNKRYKTQFSPVEPRPLEDRPPCQMVKDNIWVDAEGTVILCIGSKQTLIGNVNETSMAQIVHSQVRLDVLRQHWEGDYDKGLCSNCEQWYSAYGTTTDESEYNAFMSPDTQYYRGKGPIEIGW